MKFNQYPSQHENDSLKCDQVQAKDQSSPLSQDVLLDVFQSLDEGLVLLDQEFKVVMINSKFEEMIWPENTSIRHGNTIQDILRVTGASGELIFPENVTLDDWIEVQINHIRNYDKDVEITHRDGRQLLQSTHKTGRGDFLVITRDVSLQRKTEEARIEADMLLHKIVEACPANFLVSRVSDGRIIYIPPASRERFGDIKSALSFFLRPEDREAYLNALLPTGELNDYRVQFRRRDGSIMQGLTSARVTDYKGEDVIVSSTRDITEQLAMQAELEQQRENAHQNEKISALGGLLAGVAHELNNPLSIVVGYALMLKDKTTDPEVKRRVDRIGHAAERCAKIVKTFLAMARQKPTEIKNCNLNHIVQDALDITNYGLKTSGVKVVLVLEPDLPLIAADHDQLTQVLTNLIINAEHALIGKEDDARLTIRTNYDELLNEVIIDVHDNGVGIEKAIHGRIFEPFFTTKDIGNGTGVGLAFCHRIISAHDGDLSFRSTPGVETCFTVRLKATNTSLLQNNESKSSNLNTSQLNILVVDDEEDVAWLIRDLLEDHNYQVTVCLTAEKALKKIESNHIDIVLSDVKMPGMGGEEFLEAIRSIKPELVERTGFVTGDTMSPRVAEFFKRSGQQFIEKPVAPDELVNFVEELWHKHTELING
ncbi:MAG: ATP-binding protein [Halopseudomonas aestusnigri]